MPILFLYFLKRDSRARHAWIIRILACAPGLILAGWAQTDDFIPPDALGPLVASFLGVVASLTTLNDFREHAWRETLMLVHATSSSAGRLFLTRLAARCIPFLLGFAPVFLLLWTWDFRADASLWLPCAPHALLAIPFGISAGMLSSCLPALFRSKRSEMGCASLIWIFFLFGPLLFSYYCSVAFASFGHFRILVIVLVIFPFGCFSYGFLRFSLRLIRHHSGSRDRIKLPTLLALIPLPFILVILPGTVFKYRVFPAAPTMTMISIACVSLHLACRMERDSKYIRNSPKWRFLDPLVDWSGTGTGIRKRNDPNSTPQAFPDFPCAKPGCIAPGNLGRSLPWIEGSDGGYHQGNCEKGDLGQCLPRTEGRRDIPTSRNLWNASNCRADDNDDDILFLPDIGVIPSDQPDQGYHHRRRAGTTPVHGPHGQGLARPQGGSAHRHARTRSHFTAFR